MNIHQHINDRVQLAKTYALDGAFHTAAKLFNELAVTVEAHAYQCDRELQRAGDKSKKGK